MHTRFEPTPYRVPAGGGDAHHGFASDVQVRCGRHRATDVVPQQGRERADVRGHAGVGIGAHQLPLFGVLFAAGPGRRGWRSGTARLITGAVSCGELRWAPLPCRAVPCRAVPCRAVPCGSGRSTGPDQCEKSLMILEPFEVSQTARFLAGVSFDELWKIAGAGLGGRGQDGEEIRQELLDHHRDLEEFCGRAAAAGHAVVRVVWA
ncbi:DUF1877 family protein [Streptomyces asoensis]